MKRRKLLPLFFIISAAFLYFIRIIYLTGELSFNMLPGVSPEGFFVNTSGCKIPALDPWDETVKIFYKASYHYKCRGRPSFLCVYSNAIVSLDKAVLQYYYEVEPENVSCIFYEIQRDTSIVDEHIDNRVVIYTPLDLTFDIPLGIEFIKTACILQDKELFIEYLPLTPKKPDLENHLIGLKNEFSNRPLNIIILGLDSVSHLNFLRHFPKCKTFTSNHSVLFKMNGYTKVGDNTFPNLMPFLTGHFYQDIYDEKNNKTMFFDDVDFIWKTFKKLGYKTLLAEDAPNIATFNYLRSGFKNPPTDYYYRPFALAVENSDVKKQSKPHCFGNKMEMEVIYDYLKSFINTTSDDHPYFTFVFLARLTHDLLNDAGYADAPTFNLLTHLEDTKVFENSLVIFFSDHGIRYGEIRKTVIGQFEERMPFMNIFVPKWFLQKYKEFEVNMKANMKQLTTPFDIHATLRHLASIISGDELDDSSERGISLFKEMPSNRTCSMASISPHWCPCQNVSMISTSDYLVEKAAEAIIDLVNVYTSALRSKCAALTLKKVLSARIARKNNLNFPDEFLITVLASPSDAVFEATVHCGSRKGDICYVIDDISRINKYGMQSICVNDANLRKFCYCL